MASKKELKGKVALITGASRGIGEVTAKLLAKEGVRVVLSARSENDLKKNVDEIKASGGEAAFIVGDAAKDEDVKASVDFAEKTFGRLDIIFANAGWEGPMTFPLHETSAADIHKTIDLNFTGPLILVKYAVPALKKQGGGIIIFNSSLAALIPVDMNKMPSGLQLYSIAKAGLPGLARALTSYDVEGISSYCVCPAVFETRMVTEGIKAPALKAMNINSPSDFANFNPLNKGKPGNPEDVAKAVLHLCDGTTQYRSGDSIVVDGDTTWNAHEFYQTISLPGELKTPNQQRNLKGDLK